MSRERVIEMTEYERDPRPDLTEEFKDHAEWVAMLTLAMAEGGDDKDSIHGILHGLRCGGATLTPSTKYGLIIEPGQWDKAAYEAVKQRDLAPRTAQVLRLLQAAAAKVKSAPAHLQEEANSVRESVAARVRAVEDRLTAAGWTRPEIWSESEFNTNAGYRMSSLFLTLLNDCCWEIVTEPGGITDAFVTLRWGPAGCGVVNRLYRKNPGVSAQGSLMTG